MARTSRNGVPAANVDALDNLNLDDMFADGGDILFDGLDIDLENMDDITSSQDGNKKSDATVPLAPPAPAPAAGAATARRRTPRTSRAPFPYRDDDDEEYTDEPARKKKKTKAGSPKRKISKKSSSSASTPLPEEVPKVGAKSKRGKVAASSMPPPVARPTPHASAAPAASASGTSATSVAASGQFGGRQKRGNSVTSKAVKVKTSLPTVVDTKPKNRPSTSPPAPPTSTTVANLSQVKQTHPGLMQSDYCGMMPSRTAFYPFMASLPSEPALKNRKVYALIDRIHSSFLGHLSSSGKPSGGINPAQRSEPIFQLIQEAYKHEKPIAGATIPSRTEIIGNSIGVLRRTISMFDRARLAGDMFALCALLKRQHDFLKQNSENMKLWCKDNLPENEYASVYLSPKKDKKKTALPLPVQMSVLASFTTAEIKVKLICNGAKEQKQPLVAMLQIFMPGTTSGTPKVVPPSTKSKKRKLSTITSSESQSSPPRALPVLSETKVHKPAYPELTPNKRRRVVADMISQAARSIELLKLQKQEDFYFSLTQSEADARKVAEEEVPMIHTTGMWQWIEKSGYFSPLSRQDILQRLESFLPDGINDREQSGLRTDRFSVQFYEMCQGAPVVQKQSMQCRLRSLLLEDDASDSETSNNDDFSRDDDEQSVAQHELTSNGATHVLIEPFRLHQLTLESVVQNRSSTDDTRKDRNYAKARIGDREDQDLGAGRNGLDESDLDEITEVMRLELVRLDYLNRKRSAFLKKNAVMAETTPLQTKNDLEQETALIAKYQQVLKRSREMAKSGKSKPANDRFAIPW